MASPKDLGAVGRAASKGITPAKRIRLGAGMRSRALSQTFGSLPGMSLQAEDAFGIRPANRRLAVKGVLGSRSLSGVPGAPGVSGRGRRSF